MTHTHVVVMGVAGCGKSTVARQLSEALRWPMAEGDELHPEANIVKMAAGIPLTDEDRWPWLAAITEWTTEQDVAGFNTVVTCSALRRSYRDRLRAAKGHTVFVHLAGSDAVLGDRISDRPGHFMPPSLLPSQLATLEQLGPDEDGVVLDITAPVSVLVDEAIGRLGLSAAT